MIKLYLILVLSIICSFNVFPQNSYTLEKKWGGHGGGSGLFNTPLNTTSDNDKNIYVVDYFNGRVQKFDSTGKFIAFIGRKGVINDGDFYGPFGICIDDQGILYVSDFLRSRINRFNLSGVFEDYWNYNVLNIKYSNSTKFLYAIKNNNGDTNSVLVIDSQGTLIKEFGHLNSAQGIELTDTFIFVTDYIEKENIKYIRLSKFNYDGVLLEEYTSDYVYNQSSPVNQDIEIFNNNILISQRNQILVYDQNYQLLKTIKPSDIDPEASEPAGLESYGDFLLVSFSGTNKTYIIDSDFNVILSFGESGGMGSGFLNFPIGVAVDKNSAFVYIADFLDNRIQKFTLDGQLVTGWKTTVSIPNNLTDLAIDSHGNIFAEGQTGMVVKYDKDGNFIKQLQVNNDNGMTESMCVDFNDNVYVTSMNGKVYKFSNGGVLMSSWGEAGVSNGQLSSPRGIAVTSIGNIFIVDKGQGDSLRIQKFTNDGSYIKSKIFSYSFWNGNPRISPISIDNNDNLFVLDDGDDQDIKVFNSDLEIIQKIELGKSEIGANLNFIGMDIDNESKLYITEKLENYLYKYVQKTSTIKIPIIPDTVYTSSSYILNWLSENVDSVNLYLSTEDPKNWEEIEKNYSIGENYSVQIPSIVSNNCFFKVESSKDSNTFAISNQFVIDSVSSSIGNELLPINDITINTAGRKRTIELTFTGGESTGDSIAWSVNNGIKSFSDNFTFQFPQGSNVLTKYSYKDEVYTDSVLANINITNFFIPFGNEIVSPVSVNADGGLSFYVKNDGVYNTTIDGKINYSIAINGISDATVSIDFQGNYYFAVDKQVYAYDKTGKALWPVITIGSSIMSSIVLDENNSQLFFITDDYHLFIYTLDKGIIKGIYKLQPSYYFEPIIGNNNFLYIIDGKKSIKVFDLNVSNYDLNLVNEYNHDEEITSSLSIDFDQSIYFTSNNKINKISLDSSNHYVDTWTSDLSSSILFNPIIDTENRLIIGTNDSKLYSIDGSTGSQLWMKELSANLSSFPAFSENNYVYITDTKNVMTCYNSSGDYVYHYNSKSSIERPLLYYNGAIYLSNNEGYIISVYDDYNNSLFKINSESVLPWGTFQGNNQRSGKQPEKGNTTNIEERVIIPTQYELFNNYPNPFNPTTTIKYSLPKESMVTITIFNILGQKVVDLIEEIKSIGIYNVEWNASHSASGVYFYRIIALPTNGEKVYMKTNKMILIK